MTGAQNAAVCIRPAIVIVFSIKLRSPAQCAARERCGSCRQLIAANAAAAENASFPCDRAHALRARLGRVRVAGSGQQVCSLFVTPL